MEEILHGTIADPFVSTAPLGLNTTNKEKFVLRSTVGNTEYVVEIPKGGEDYDIEIPLASLNAGERPLHLSNPEASDRELVGALPDPTANNSLESSSIDKAFGVVGSKGPKQSPSYVLGIAKINKYFTNKDFEYALVEINNLLTFFPNSPKLFKMKGTVLIRMENYELARKAWQKALELDSKDAVLRSGLERLDERMKNLFSGEPKVPQTPPLKQQTSRKTPK